VQLSFIVPTVLLVGSCLLVAGYTWATIKPSVLPTGLWARLRSLVGQLPDLWWSELCFAALVVHLCGIGMAYMCLGVGVVSV
jgi:hypothetical protein